MATVGANGAVVGLTITNPGSGYTAATVSLHGRRHRRHGHAAVTGTGAVTGVTVTAGGAGYVTPTVTFTGGAPDATGPRSAVLTRSRSRPRARLHVPTVDFDLPDDPAGTQATAHVMCVELRPTARTLMDRRS